MAVATLWLEQKAPMGTKLSPKRREFGDFWDFGLDFAAFSFLHRGKRV
jgi:hypothetical protein